MQNELHIFDFDEVIVDDYWFEHVNSFLKSIGRPSIKSRDELTSRFYAEENVFTDEDEYSEFAKYLEKQTPYENIEPRPYSCDVLKGLSDSLRDDVLIATALPDLLSKDYRNKEAYQKKRFVEKYFPFMDTGKQLLFIQDKSQLSGYSMTEDAISNLAGDFDKKLLYTAHHNKNISYGELANKGIIRVNDWYDIGKELV